jgi:hypothetical protein
LTIITFDIFTLKVTTNDDLCQLKGNPKRERAWKEESTMRAERAWFLFPCPFPLENIGGVKFI